MLTKKNKTTIAQVIILIIILIFEIIAALVNHYKLIPDNIFNISKLINDCLVGFYLVTIDIVAAKLLNNHKDKNDKFEDSCFYWIVRAIMLSAILAWYQSLNGSEIGKSGASVVVIASFYLFMLLVAYLSNYVDKRSTNRVINASEQTKSTAEIEVKNESNTRIELENLVQEYRIREEKARTREELLIQRLKKHEWLINLVEKLQKTLEKLIENIKRIIIKF